MVVPFLPLYLLELGVSAESVNLWSGMVFSVTFLIGAIMAPYWGARADKHGKRKMVIRSGISLAVVYLLGAFVQNPYELFVLRVLQGFASGFVPAAMSIVASATPSGRTGWSLGIMQTASAIGVILGPLFGGIWSHFFSIRLSFVIAAIAVFLATVAVGFFVREQKIIAEKEAVNFIDSVKTAVGNKVFITMLFLLLAVQMTVMIRQPIITIYVKELTGTLDRVVLYSGVIFSLVGISGIMAAPYWGNIGQKRGFLKILFVVLLGAGAANIMTLFIEELWQFGLLQFVFGLFLAGIYPSINAIVVNHTAASYRGRAFGLMATANQLGQMIGPVVGGLCSAWLSIRLIFVFGGLFLVAASLLSWTALRQTRQGCG